MKGKAGKQDKSRSCMPNRDVGGQGANKLPTKPLRGPDKSKRPAFKTGKTG